MKTYIPLIISALLILSLAGCNKSPSAEPNIVDTTPNIANKPIAISNASTTIDTSIPDTATVQYYYKNLFGDNYWGGGSPSIDYTNAIEFLTAFIDNSPIKNSAYSWTIEGLPNGPHHFGIQLAKPNNQSTAQLETYYLINAHIACALAHRKIGNDKKFIKYLTAASSKHPNLATLNLLWLYYDEKESYKSAKAIAKRMITIDPNCDLGYLRMAQTANAQQDYDNAIAQATKALKCSVKLPYNHYDIPYYVRAEAYLGKGKLKEAYADCQKYNSIRYERNYCTCGEYINYQLIQEVCRNRPLLIQLLKNNNIPDKEIKQILEDLQQAENTNIQSTDMYDTYTNIKTHIL